MKNYLFFTALTLTITLCLYLSSNGQNLVINGDLESWTSGEPDGWTNAENISQESTTVHGGNFSAKHTSAETTQDFQQVIDGIEGGVEYTISYWYYDNDPEARTRIWSYWLSGTTTLPDHADILRPPTTYSEDNPNWLQFNAVLTAPATADGFRFEVRVYKQDNIWGGAVFYDDFEFSGDVTIDPEPSNYPTNFMANTAGPSINLTWTDAVGSQLPSAYIIFAGINPSLPVPVDGNPVPNDTDLSDGSGALNVDFGLENASFSNLESNTTYYFTIYPCTNSGSNIDFKTDGSAPTADATTANTAIIESENFDVSWGNWTPVSVVGAQVWDRNNTYGIDNTPCARMSGFSGTPLENDDWLISPALNLDDYDNETLIFYTAMNYTGPDLECKISTDYDGSGDPYAGSWTTLSYTMSPGSWEWTESGVIDISAYNGSEVYIAFQYTSNTSEAATWEVDNILIAGEEDVVIDPEPSNYPTDFSATEAGSSIHLSWTDAVGSQLPDKYIIFAGINSSLPVPVDGTPVPNDPDLSDGSASMNIVFGVEEYTFTNLPPSTMYYFTIYPYTNSGVNIDYKTDGTAPTANATSSNVVTVVIEEENFDESWGNWTPVSVVGAQVWDRNNNFGIGNTPCAKMSGYDGQSYENDDWLISPALNLDNYENEVLVFYNAKNYSGPDLELKVSTDYDGGGDPSSANWTTETFTMSPGSFEWTESGEIDLSGYDGTAVYVAFQFTSTNAESATWEVDDIVITGEEEAIIKPEPSNYPTAFSADGAGSAIDLTWTDATGTQLPDKYIIFAGTSASLPAPEDGIPIPDDLDLNDGLGAVNVNFGIEEFTFANLEPSTTYYFSIYPYTNSGVNINYKTDGTAPSASASTSNVVTVIIEEENFDISWGNWTPVSVVGAQVWDRDNTWGIGGTPCASMSGYDGQPYENDDWLISPALNLDNYENEILVFYNAQNYSGPDLDLKISTDYDGSGDPYSATWSSEPFTMSPGSFDWTESGEIDLSAYDGNAVYVAFHFTSTNAASATWEIDDIAITGEEEATIDPEPTNYPINFMADASGISIELTWTDAIGEQLPDRYLIYAGTDASLPIPEDGTPVANDMDLSDGSGALNINYGIEVAVFNGLVASTTYYFTIYPYTNTGSAIDYKNDGTAPAANATTEEPVTVVIESEDFNESWGNWTTISVVGAQVWDRDNTFGIENTPCARMSGYSGEPLDNDDWLISPPLNLDNYDNEKLTFYTAMNYDGPDLELKISTDYDGGGNPNTATWTSLSYTMSPGSWEWTLSGEIDLSSFIGSAVYVAFHYTSNTSAAATWEVDDVEITGDEGMSSDDQFTVDNLFNIYPNPATGFLYVEKTDLDINEVSIISATGKIVKSMTIGTGYAKIDLTALTKGIYIVLFRNEITGQTASRKLILN